MSKDVLAAAGNLTYWQRRAAQAEAEITRLQTCLDTERRVPLGRYAFYHRHRALAYVRAIDPALHQEASNAACAEIACDGGKSFEDVVAALEAERDAAQRRAEQAESDAAALRRALDTIDRCPVGACESPTGDIEPCDSCGEMRTIAEQALRETDAGRALLAEMSAARALGGCLS